MTIETGLFQIQAQTIDDRRQKQERSETKIKVFHDILKQFEVIRIQDNLTIRNTKSDPPLDRSLARSPDATDCFFRLAKQDGEMLNRIGRYEVSLWRQAAQTLLILESVRKQMLPFVKTFRRKIRSQP